MPLSLHRNSVNECREYDIQMVLMLTHDILRFLLFGGLDHSGETGLDYFPRDAMSNLRVSP